MTLHPMIPALALVVLAATTLAICVLAALRRRVQAGQRRRWVPRATAIVLLLAALARPGITGASAPVATENLDIFLVIDRSGSMNAQDFGSHRPRIEGVRAQLKKLAAQSIGARFSVIGFSDKAYVTLPLTDNSEALVNALDSFALENTAYSHGSSIDAAKATLKATLQRDRDRYGHQRRRIIIYVGDGEQNSGRPVHSFADLGPLVDAGFVLGYGTSLGGQMYVTDPLLGAEANRVYIDTPAGTRAVSRIDEGNLKTIAAELGTSYQHMAADTDVKKLTATLRTQAVTKNSPDKAGYGETYWVPMGGAALLIALELGLIRRQQRSTRQAGT